MKKFLFILFLFMGTLSYGQTTFTQTFVDRCTGDVKVVVANFVNGSATVAFYDKVRTFTYQQYVSGELQQWLTETYLWWESLSPCSTATSESQNAQQTAQNATSAAQSAANAASSTPPPTTGGTTSTPPPNTDSTATNNTTGGNTNASSSGTGSTESQSTNQNTNTENTNQSDTTSGESSQTETGGGGESTETSQDTSSGESTESQNTETEDTSQETSGEVENTESSETESTEETSTEESSNEETSSEESTEESSEESTEESSEESTEESSEEESSESEEESSEEETEEESNEEESEEDSEEESDDEESEEDTDDDSEEKEEEKEKKKMLPIQLRADMMANQSLLGNYDIVTSIGATQSSIYGDETYGATAMIWSNLRQFSLNGSYTKVKMQEFDVTSIKHQTHKHHKKGNKVTSEDPQQPPVPRVSIVTSASLGYMNNFGNGTFVASMMKIKPTKYGTFGVGVNMINMFAENKYQMTMLGYNALYTNVINVSPRIQYSPALIWSQSPYMGKIRWERDEYYERYLTARNDLRGTRIHGMAILSNSFTIQLTRRFSINTGATFIKSTNKDIPLIKSFTIGTKLPF